MQPLLSTRQNRPNLPASSPLPEPCLPGPRARRRRQSSHQKSRRDPPPPLDLAIMSRTRN
ncbi:hypothetical protein BKA81DRAFT_372394 [Phyllosticta paracitricarpa]